MDISLSSQDRRVAAKQASESPADASAALEEAVKTAKLGLKPASSTPVATGQPPAPRSRSFPIGLMGQAAVALLLVGAGWSASYMGTLANRDAIRQLEAETARSQEILERLSTELGALKETVVAYKDVEYTSSTASAAEQTDLTDKVERLTISLQEPGRKLTALEGRLERMESQILTTIAGLNTKPAAPAAPAPAEAALREDAPKAAKIDPIKSDPIKSEPVKSEPVDGWVLREVYNGAALVENRNRRLYEVMPGGMLPGVGRIEGIERRGARWVVVTDKGFIGTYR